MRAAVLGAGIAGCCTAVLLARRGYAVTLYEEAAAPLQGASRWNEGRVHLGYVYGADTTLATAKRLIPAGLAFRPVMEEILEEPLAPAVTREDDSYLVHKDSVIAPDPLAGVLDAVNALVRAHPNAHLYPGDARHAPVRRMDKAELCALTDSPDIVAGFKVMERSIETGWFCDRLASVVAGTPGLTLRPNTRVAAARPVGAEDGPWRVTDADGGAEVFDLVINTAWNGLLEIDRTAGLPLPAEWSHRDRTSLFIRTARPVPITNMFVTVGPFGIVKNHGDRDFYLSWYETGLRAYTEAVAARRAPPMTPEEKARFIAETRAALVRLMPGAEAIFEAAETVTVQSGLVLAQATGDIGDPAASLHTRDRFGIRRRGRFLSVDTGKFAAGPWVARAVADMVAPARARAAE